MRKPDAAAVAARRASQPASLRDQQSVRLVCLALALALIVLVARIGSIW
jgi:hypothetical protein